MELLYLLVSLLLAITLHEFAHALTSDYLGDTTARSQGRLSLNPLAHIDPVMTVLLPLMLIIFKSPVIFGAARPVPFNPWSLRWGKWGVALVAIAGPITNFLVAAVVAAWLQLVNLGPGAAEFLHYLIVINVALGVFNLIPFPPLDGSRVLYAVAPLGLRSVMDQIERAGVAALFIFLFVGLPLLGPVVVDITESIVSWLVPGATRL